MEDVQDRTVPVGRVVYKDLCADVGDLDAAAAFFSPLLGLEERYRRPAVLQLGDGVDQHTLWLNLVPEARTAKNRVHLDVDVASVDEVVAAAPHLESEFSDVLIRGHLAAGRPATASSSARSAGVSCSSSAASRDARVAVSSSVRVSVAALPRI